MERGKTLMQMRRVTEAVAAFDSYVALGGKEANVTKYRAQMQLKSAQPAKAQDTYAKALASAHATPETYAEASEVYLAQGNAARGEQVLREAIQRFPGNAYLVLRLGAYLGAVTRYDEAVRVLEEARGMTPDNPAILRTLTVARVRRGDTAGAVESAARLYDITKDTDAALFYAARLEGNKQHGEAERLYREVLAREPDNALALNNLAALLGRGNMLDEAEQLARRATTRVPDNGHVLDTLGWVLYRRGKHEDAAAALARAVMLAPDAGLLRYHQGIVLESLGRRDEARTALREAVRLEDGGEWVGDARSRLAVLK
jgi:tetratricopeptide (TPR) repeat protein